MERGIIMTDLETGMAIGMLLAPKSNENQQYLADLGTLNAVIENGAGHLTIGIISSEKNENDEYTVSTYNYTYEMKTITESVTTSSSSGGTTTKFTKSWSRSLVDKLYNASGKLIMQAVYADEEAEEKGIVSHYLDENGKQISIS